MNDEAFLAPIYAALDDDEPRRVYADWLLEHGDPRGELIQLQLQPAGAPARRARERDLWSLHRQAWVADAGVDPAEAVFARGFLAIAKPTRPMTPSRTWATVHTLVEAVPPDGVAMPSLRVLDRLTDHHIEELASHHDPLTVREVRWSRRGQRQSPFAPYGQIAVLPALEQLSVERGLRAHGDGPERAAWLWDPPWARSLAQVVLTAPIDSLAAWHAALGPTHLDTIVICDGEYNDPLQWRCTIGRDRLELAYWNVHPDADRALHRLADGVAALAPHTLMSVQITMSAQVAAWRPAIMRMFANQATPVIAFSARR